MKHLTILTLLFFSIITHAYSQDFEGTILYEVSYMNLTEEMKNMLPDNNPQSLFSIKGNKTKMEMDMMGTKMILISDIETNTSTSYMDVMGQKIKSTTPMQELEEIEIQLIEGETKNIAGYLCKKAILKQSDSPDVEVYYTEELQSSAFLSVNSQFKKLNGIPLEYQMHQKGMTMMSSAKEVVEKSLNSRIFDAPAGEYKEAPAMPKY